MEIKIKNNNEMIDATIEMIDGIMVVSPKEVKFEPKEVKFEPKDGDVFCVDSLYPCVGIVTEEYSYGKPDKDRLYFLVGYWKQSGDIQFGTFCACNRNTQPNYRPATEEEKKELFDKIKEEGYEWDANKKVLVKIKWKPTVDETIFVPYFDSPKFLTKQYLWEINGFSTYNYDKGWVFRTKEECEQFCKKLNKAIEGVKP